MVTNTNTPDSILLISRKPPAERTRIRTYTEERYWFHGPFSLEGPVTERRMHECREDFPKCYVDRGWWEKTTVVTTRVSELVEF